MSASDWLGFFLSSISSAVQLFVQWEILGVPVLYVVLSVSIVGVVISALLFKS